MNCQTFSRISQSYTQVPFSLLFFFITEHVSGEGEERERSKFPLTAHASFCNLRSPLRSRSTVFFSRPLAPLPLIQFSDPLCSRSAPLRTGGCLGVTLLWPSPLKNIVAPLLRKIYVKGKMDYFASFATNVYPSMSLPLHRIFSSSAPTPAHPVFGPTPLHFPLPLRSHKSLIFTGSLLNTG